MAHIVTLNTPSREDWLTQLADVVTSPDELLHLLNVDADANLLAGREANASSPCAFRGVYRPYGERQPQRSLLRQVLTSQDEFISAPGFPPIRWKNSTAWCPVCCINTATGRCCW
jgi:L-lysine 2,3-aminomutase